MQQLKPQSTRGVTLNKFFAFTLPILILSIEHVLGKHLQLNTDRIIS